MHNFIKFPYKSNGRTTHLRILFGSKESYAENTQDKAADLAMLLHKLCKKLEYNIFLILIEGTKKQEWSINC